MKSRSTTIAFRLPPPYDAELESRARAKKLSAGKHAKALLMEALADTQRHRVAEDIEALQAEVAELRRLIRNALLVLLAHAGQLSEDQANAWVRQYFDTPGRRRGPGAGE